MPIWHSPSKIYSTPKCQQSDERAHSLCVILPSKDAADVWDEPLGRVESQNPHAMVTLQPQLKEDNVRMSVLKTCIFHDSVARCLCYSWPTSCFKSHLIGHKHVHETRDVTQAVNFTHTLSSDLSNKSVNVKYQSGLLKTLENTFGY